MFISKIIYRSLSIIGLSFVFSISAFAQSTILVVDTGRVLRDSDVGKHISTQLASIGSSMQSETQAKTSAMESKGKSLNEELKGKTQEDLKNDPALLSKVQSFQKEQQELSVDVQYKQQEMKITENKAIQKVQDRLRVILELIVKERGADVVLERSLVIYGDPVDVTDVVITRLNSQLKTVPVKRERLPRQ